MKKEIYYYRPIEQYVTFNDLKMMLPDGLLKHVLTGSRYDYIVAVDGSDKEGVYLLDEFYNIPQSRKISKEHVIEITKSEIPKYTHFMVVLNEYESGGYGVPGKIYFDQTRPTCTVHRCDYGSQVTGPFAVAEKALKKLGIGFVEGVWTNVGWLLSPHVKALFDEEEITGLEYEPCVIHGKPKGEHPDPPAYIGRPTSMTFKRADEVVTNDEMCPEHRFGGQAFGERYDRDEFNDNDIQVIGGVRSDTDDLVYYRRMPVYVITRRLLELLLKYKVKGLTTMTIEFNEKFIPIVFEDGRGSDSE